MDAVLLAILIIVSISLLLQLLSLVRRNGNL